MLPVQTRSSARPRLGALSLLLFFTACAIPRRGPGGPLLGVTLDHFPGSVLTGPVGDSSWEERADDPWAVEFRFAYLETAPKEPGEPLSTVASYVFVERSEEPLRTRGELALAVRWFETPERLAPSGWEMHEQLALWSGTTAACRTVRRVGMDDAAAWEALDVEVSRAAEGDGIELALVLEGMVVPHVEPDGPELLDGENPPAQPEPVRQREHVVLDRGPQPDGAPLRLFVPLATAASPQGGVVVDVAVRRVDEETLASAEFTDALERGRADLALAAEQARTRSAGLTPVESFRFGRATALEALRAEKSPRSTLIFLGRATGARVSGDLALVASDEALADYVAAVREELDDPELGGEDAVAFGWILERASYRWLAQRAEGEDGLELELSSILLRHAGALGRYPDLVLEAALESAGADELEQRFLAENRILLEDSHPAVRVRAYDWMMARDVAPATYDPLDPRDERRAALAAFDAASDEEPPGEEGPDEGPDDDSRDGEEMP